MSLGLLIFFGFLSLLFLFVIFILVTVNRVIGIKNLLIYLKAWKGRNKGLVLLRIYSKVGNVWYRLGTQKGSELVTCDLKGDGKIATFISDSHKVYFNEMNIRTLDVFENDDEARSWINNYDFPVSPLTFENINVNSIKSESASNWLEDFIKKWGKLIGLFLLILFAIMGFIMLHQMDTITQLSMKLAGTHLAVVK